MGLMSAQAAPVTAKKAPISKAQDAKVSKRGIASVACTDSSCLCEEIKKLSYTCSESLDKISAGVEDQNRKQLRQIQSDIATRRRQVADQGRSCPAVPATDACFEHTAKILAQKNVRVKDIKNENTSELLGFGSEVLLKIGNPPGRLPAAQK